MRGVLGSVLVAEDDPLSRRVLEQILVSGGFLVETASDGQEAFQKARSSRPDVLVTDWTMPRMDGITLCRLLKAADETRFIHVIMLSSHGETESKVTGLDTGADDYLVKPVDPTELQARVRTGLRLQRTLHELAAKNELLERLALTDPLTGLANRRAFEEALATETSRVRRHGRSASLLMLDLDRFKLVNDTYGHVTGDEVLAEVADRLRRCARRGDIVARLGGEEFALLLPATPRPQAILVAERIRKLVDATPLGSGARVSVTVSIGVASLLAGPAEDFSGVLREADAALYMAKAEGRNRVAVLDPTGPAPSGEGEVQVP